MATSEERLKSRLVEVGSKLGKPATSVNELLALLDRVEVCLSLVEQSPPKGIQKALRPTLKALVCDELLKRADADVKVAVAACLSEITRITAPEVPYDDDRMKEAFQLIVSSFEGLDDKSSQSYSKRTSILETFARVRLCVVMLDLEFDELILEMFRHFIKAIRDYHPENVFNCMEDIMIRVIEESEAISSDLLFCILEAVRKDNQEVMPVACKLMKKVIGTCADKIRPYIKIAVAKGLRLSQADYGDVVNHMCNEISAERVVQSEHISTSAVEAICPNKSAEPMADTVQTAEETSAAVVNSTETFSTDGCADLVKRNGDTGTKGCKLSGSSSLQYPNLSNVDKASETIAADPSSAVHNLDGPERTETDTKASMTVDENPPTTDGNLEKEDEGKSKIEPITEIIKKQGRKTKAKNCNKKTSESKLVGNSIGAVEQDVLVKSLRSIKKDVCTAPHQESSNEAAEHGSLKPSKNDGVPSKGISGETKEIADKLNECSKSKTMVSSFGNHTSLDNKTTIYAVCHLEEGTTNPTIDVSGVDVSVSTVGVPLEKTNAPDAENLKVNTTILASDAVHKTTAPTVDVPVEEVKSRVEKSTKQLRAESKHTHEVKHAEKVRGSGKATLQKHAVAAENNHKKSTITQKSAMKSVKDEKDLKETPKTTTKRKRIEENKNGKKDFGEELVGSQVKVWWPADKRYYKGVIESFNSAKKKHKVLYNDGEVENLVLKKERWEVINLDEDTDMEEESDHETPDIASGKRIKGKEVDGGTSRKRLERLLSSKSKSASNKPSSKLRDDSKAVAKEKTSSSKVEGKFKKEGVNSASNSRAELPSSSVKSKGGYSRSSNKRKSESKNAVSLPKIETRSVRKKDSEGKGTKSGDKTAAMKSAVKSKTGESSKSKGGSTAKSKGKSPKTTPKSNAKLKAPKMADSDPSDSDSIEEEAAEQRSQSHARATRSSKRKELVLEKGLKSEQKRKKRRRL